MMDFSVSFLFFIFFVCFTGDGCLDAFVSPEFQNLFRIEKKKFFIPIAEEILLSCLRIPEEFFLL